MNSWHPTHFSTGKFTGCKIPTQCCPRQQWIEQEPKGESNCSTPCDHFGFKDNLWGYRFIKRVNEIFEELGEECPQSLKERTNQY